MDRIDWIVHRSYRDRRGYEENEERPYTQLHGSVLMGYDGQNQRNASSGGEHLEFLIVSPNLQNESELEGTELKGRFEAEAFPEGPPLNVFQTLGIYGKGLVS